MRWPTRQWPPIDPPSELHVVGRSSRPVQVEGGRLWGAESTESAESKSVGQRRAYEGRMK